MKNSAWLRLLIIIVLLGGVWYFMTPTEDNRQKTSSWVIIPHGNLEDICTPNEIQEIVEYNGKAKVVLKPLLSDEEPRELITNLTVEQMNARVEQAIANQKR